MNPFGNMMPGNDGPNLWSIILNVAFGFVAGLIVFIGFKEVIEQGTKIAESILSMTGMGDQMGGFGFATSAAPYLIVAPIAGMVVRELSSVRSLKGFAIFALAVAIGFVIAFLTKSYFA